jgi:signal transduction histidine kinase
LGLAIARALTEAQGGTVTLRNAGAGCHVEVTLPLA